jgi:carboxyl-terminal processing protease
MTFRLLFLIAGMAGFLVSAPARAADDSASEQESYKMLNLLGDVFERVRSDYVEEITDKKLIEAAINGMLVSLDPHSSYLNAESFEEMRVQTKGEFGGLGIEVTMDKGLVKVVSPIDDTPAFRAGIEPGDFISALDGEAVMGLTLSEAVEKMRGLVGTDLKLTILREGSDPFDVTITRAVIKIRSVRSRLEKDIGYLRITSFNDQTMIGVDDAIKTFQKEEAPLKGIVLDLRNNPGGLLDQAIKVSDAFLEMGEIVSTRSRNPEASQRFNARAGDLAEGMPMVVLINGGSASASEIVAGALQDHNRAVLLGTKSFGKGSVQTIIPLPGNAAMRLTTARYFTPSGRSIQSVGIEPDILVEQARIETLKPRSRRREADLRGALSNGNDDKKTEPDKDKDTKAPPVENKGGKPDKGDKNDKGEEKAEAPQDYQLSRALDLLRGLSLFSDKVKVSQR